MKSAHLLLLLPLMACSPKGTATASPRPLATGSNAVAPTAVPDAVEPVPTAQPGPGAALRDVLPLIPDGAEVIVGIDAARVVRSEVGEFVVSLFEGELRDTVEDAEACGVGPQSWRFAVISQKTGGSQQSAGVFSATGLGREPTLRCLAERVQTLPGQNPPTVARENGRLVSRGANEVVFAISDDTVAVATLDWSEALGARLDGQGSSAIDGGLREPMSLVDTSQAVFIAATGPGGQGPMGFAFLTGGLSFVDGLSFSAFLHFAEANEAEQNAQAIRTQFDQVRGMASGLGLPQAVVDRVQIDSQGRAVHVRGRFTAQEFEQTLGVIQGIGATP